MPKSLIKALSIPYDFLSAVKHDFERNILSNHIGLKPKTINFLANDICNSRCTMCLIWKQKRDTEVTPDQLRQILGDPLFNQVSYVGVSGGEPTLRKDLPELYEVICATLPRLRAAGIITNAIQEKQVIDRIAESIEVCNRHKVKFSLMVSVDGVGEIHDLNRGRSGNFETALSVLNYFQKHFQMPISIGCTITKFNVWHVDQLLDFCIANNIYGRFRIAEFITRLYNENETETIRNFTEDECYHLALFFARLEQYEQHRLVKRTYRSIRRMLYEDQPRSIGCPYQSRAVLLDSRGQLLYCAPKSKVIGSTLEKSAMRLYQENLSERRRIRQEHCKDCIHDYHSTMTLQEFSEIYTSIGWRQLLSVRTGLLFSQLQRR
jgi:MoaA/NifB/PqqE/SkfB family radical SAM enzyme